MKASHGIVPVFDGPKLVSAAGLVPVPELAESAGLSDAVEDACTLPAANVVVKARTVVAGMLAGADSIDDLNVLRAGGTARVLGRVRAPSTIGTFLRSFTHVTCCSCTLRAVVCWPGSRRRSRPWSAGMTWSSWTWMTRSVRSTDTPRMVPGSGIPGCVG